MLSEVDEDNTGQVPFSEFLKVIEKQQSASDEDEGDLLDAFVAMGGNPDKTDLLRILMRMTLERLNLMNLSNF